MLVLTRKRGESVIIGDTVKVVVLGTSGNAVRLGIDAPKEVSVHRDEIYYRNQRKKIKEREGECPPSSDVKRL